MKPAKSAGLHPLAEDGAGGGRMLPPTGCTSAVTVPTLLKALRSVPRVNVVGVGETSLSPGNPKNAKYENLYVCTVMWYSAAVNSLTARSTAAL